MMTSSPGNRATFTGAGNCDCEDGSSITVTIAVVLCVQNLYHHADAGNGDDAKYYHKDMIIKRFNDVYDNIGRMILLVSTSLPKQET